MQNGLRYSRERALQDLGYAGFEKVVFKHECEQSLFEKQTVFTFCFVLCILAEGFSLKMQLGQATNHF